MKERLPKHLQKELLDFIEGNSLRKFSNSLRRVVFGYIAHEDRFGLPVDIGKFLTILNDLFDLLDLADKYKQRGTSK